MNSKPRIFFLTRNYCMTVCLPLVLTSHFRSINSSGKTATICLNALSRCSPSVVPFIMTIKLWTKLYVDWFPSKFVFTALALFYLQRCQIIPPIQNIKVTNSMYPITQLSHLMSNALWDPKLSDVCPWSFSFCLSASYFMSFYFS